MLNGHGDDLHLQSVKIKHNFSSNVYYKGCPKPLLSVLKAGLSNIESYPSPLALELNVLAAKQFNLEPESFLFGNGATELFYLIAQSFKGQSATIVGPTFSEYEDASKIHGLNITHALWENINTLEYNTNIVFICNPNNPTGEILTTDSIENLLSNNKSVQFIIDEAYIEFTIHTESVVQLINSYPNLCIVRSLTKTFTIPGLRLGYVIAQPEFIDRLSQFKMPWTVNALAILAGEYIFSQYKTLQFNANHLLTETEQFKADLQTVPYLELVKGYTSYVLVKLLKGKAKDLKTYLVNQHGILIRDATNFTGLKGEYFRVSVQSKEANATLIKALKTWS